jgi:glycosyltransferase involved in cell wall biosynthesis
MFSVVIPLYNKERHVKEAIDSVLRQTVQDLEIIIINDGSKDGSLSEAENFDDSRIRIINQTNSGVSVARNRGVEASHNQFIAFLDADDVWLEDHLENIKILIKKFPNAGLYASAYEKLDSSGVSVSNTTKTLPLNKRQLIIPNYFESCVRGDNLIWTSATCIPRRIFLDSNIWFPAGEAFGEDLYVWARIAMIFDIAYDVKPSAVYNLDADDNTKNKILNEIEPHQSILALSNFKYFIKDSEKLAWFNKYFERHILNFIIRNIWNNKKYKALNQARNYSISFLGWLKIIFALIIPNTVYVKAMAALSKLFR